MSSAEDPLSAKQRGVLLDVARRSVAHGLRQACPLQIEASHHDAVLQAPRATFVTLQRAGQLRGCVGSLEVRRPLINDVVENAFKAAFRDPRFSPLKEEEFADLELHISVLSPLERLPTADEEELLENLRPGIDGLLLREAQRDATFLPSVWESLPDAGEFLRRLKEKAGLSRNHWSPQIEAFRYTAESFS